MNGALIVIPDIAAPVSVPFDKLKTGLALGPAAWSWT